MARRTTDSEFRPIDGRPTLPIAFGQGEASPRNRFAETLCGVVFGNSGRTRRKTGP